MTRRPTTTEKRKRPTESQWLRILSDFGATFQCPGPKPNVSCKFGGVFPVKIAERDHIGRVSDTKDNSPENFQPLCPECHGVKTRGEGATTAGSDVGEAAKTKRMEKKRLADEALARGEAKAEKMKPKKKIPPKPMPKVPEGMKYNWKTGTVEERK